MAHFLCHLGCSHFGALLLDFYFTENSLCYVYVKTWRGGYRKHEAGNKNTPKVRSSTFLNQKGMCTRHFILYYQNRRKMLNE